MESRDDCYPERLGLVSMRHIGLLDVQARNIGLLCYMLDLQKDKWPAYDNAFHRCGVRCLAACLLSEMSSLAACLLPETGVNLLCCMHPADSFKTCASALRKPGRSALRRPEYLQDLHKACGPQVGGSGYRRCRCQHSACRESALTQKVSLRLNHPCKKLSTAVMRFGVDTLTE
jgi:hypothetical protein